MNKIQLNNIITRLGVPVNLSGYRVIMDAVQLCLNDPTMLHKLFYNLYPALATKHNTTVCAIERNIRHAIQVGWKRGDVKFQEEVFSNTLNPAKSNPTNSEFITTVVNYIQLLEGDDDE